LDWTQQELVTFYFDLKPIEGPSSRTGQNLAINGERGGVAGAEEFAFVRYPVDRAAQVRTLRRKSDDLTFLFLNYPSCGFFARNFPAIDTILAKDKFLGNTNS